jgi:DNA (cytosine-5)-methyltransferase 1
LFVDLNEKNMGQKKTLEKKYALEDVGILTMAEEQQIEMFRERNNFTFTPKNGALKNPYTVVSLFSGCGGMDLGFYKEGFKILWANDIDPTACETYKRNIGDHIVAGDITKIDYNTIPKCDVLLGGFPCQDFSMIWKRGGINTERGNLYRNFVDLVHQKNPKIFIAENVRGILSANKGKAIEQIVQDFSTTGKFGYNITVNLINFADYGTPQLRQRVLIIGTRKDIKEKFTIPKPTHTPDNYVSAKEALKGAEKVKFNNEHQNVQPATIEKLKLIPAGGNFSSIPKNSPHYVKGMISHVYRRLHPDKPSTTIIAAGGGGTWGYHFDEPRPLTNRERARLFGYPDDFAFVGSITEVRKQIGNSVAPVGIQVFAKHIKKFLTQVTANVH